MALNLKTVTPHIRQNANLQDKGKRQRIVENDYDYDYDDDK